ncbi:RNA ligase family protein [Mesobacillus subterraneus]|uniref:ATP-dependent DNA ligase family profile domain-containing protein n=1 Tax=Mesobacillus subterraneus TaxID=285983 RepID=A0A3R9FGS2_9BACI|nr:RNA ligase family protein [Mesobacillus subterraneus]RSD27623.1 hypothetical protein EJA10_07515 [Mesobacillus subterraneus]
MFIKPMLLQKTNDPFDNDKYITELKLDGIRIILSKWEGKVKLYTRHNNDVTSKFKELLDLNVPNGTVLDGEVVVTDPHTGKPDFEVTMERFMSLKTNHTIMFCIFDVLYWEGHKTTQMPLIERKKLLGEVLPSHPHVTPVKWIVGNGKAYFNLVKEQALEGVVFKRIDSIYQHKRSHDWLKCINYQFGSYFITGVRKDQFGVMLGKEENNKIINLGVMEFVPPEARKKIYRESNELITNETDEWIFLKAKLQCEVKYRNLTKKGLLRIPSFVDWVS